MSKAPKTYRLWLWWLGLDRHIGYAFGAGVLRFIGTARRELEACSLSGLPDEMAGRVRVQQINALSVVGLVMSVTGQGTAFLTLYEYWDLGLHAEQAIIVSIISVCYGLMLYNSLRWIRGTPLSCGGAERALGSFIHPSICLGVAWAWLEISLMHRSDPGQRSLLYGIIIGLMSAPAMVTPCSAAFAFWLPVTVGGLASIILVSSVRDLGGSVLTLGYTSLSLFCLLYLNRLLIRRVVAEVEQSDDRETISMLLKDFEDSTCDWLWETDARGRLTHASVHFADITKTRVETLTGAEFVELLESKMLCPSKEIVPGRWQKQSELASFIACKMPFRDLEITVDIAGDTRAWILTGKPKLTRDGAFEGYRGVGSDATEKKAAQDRIAFLASYDELTGLSNRRSLRDILTSRLLGVPAMQVGLLCLDLDGFKAVNDRHGHPTGDALLQAVAGRLRCHLQEADACARLGGDEFAVVISNLDGETLAGRARCLVSELSAIYHVNGYALKVGVSIGLAMADDSGVTAEQLLHDADAALYRAKASGRGTWRPFDKELKTIVTRRAELQEELTTVISRAGLHLSYQPIFNLETGGLHAVEALVRWKRSKGEFVSPSEFIPLAESCGLISDLGGWILAEACRAAAKLPFKASIAVNISPIQLRDRRLLSQLEHALKTSGLDPLRLDFEVTETAFLDMSQATLDLLDEIRAFGIGINLDDFGVGQTSLDHLRRYPFSAIKIDQSFIRDMPTSRASRAIVRGVISIAKELGIKTTAEGIETDEHLTMVRDLGCQFAQGNLLGKPDLVGEIVPADAAVLAD